MRPIYFYIGKTLKKKGCYWACCDSNSPKRFSSVSCGAGWSSRGFGGDLPAITWCHRRWIDTVIVGRSPIGQPEIQTKQAKRFRLNLTPSPQRAPPKFNLVRLMGVGGLPGGFGRAAGGRGSVFSGLFTLKTGWLMGLVPFLSIGF